MSKALHNIYIATMALVIIVITTYIAYTGFSYYSLPIEERFYHDRYDWFKPSGLFGQGLGVIGTALIAFGVTIYIAHKRYNILGKFVRLKYLLEFHIFLCTLGPILILFHTTFKFGGIVSVAFWSMVAVVLSGVIGRFIYIQIPRNLQGRSLSLAEIEKRATEIETELNQHPDIEQNILHGLFEQQINSGYFSSYFAKKTAKKNFNEAMKNVHIESDMKVKMSELVIERVDLMRKIGRVEQMTKLFKYWHIIHMPFALIMLVIVILHIAVTISLGYKWIF